MPEIHQQSHEEEKTLRWKEQVRAREKARNEERKGSVCLCTCDVVPSALAGLSLHFPATNSMVQNSLQKNVYTTHTPTHLLVIPLHFHAT